MFTDLKYLTSKQRAGVGPKPLSLIPMPCYFFVAAELSLAAQWTGETATPMTQGTPCS